MTDANRYLMGQGRPCIAMANWRFLTKSRLDALQARDGEADEFPHRRSPPCHRREGRPAVSDFYLDDKACLEDAGGRSMCAGASPTSGSDFQLYYLVRRAEDERVGALLRTCDGERWRLGRPSGRPPDAGPGVRLLLGDDRLPVAGRPDRHRPRRRREGAALPKNDQPKLEARTLTPDGHRVFSFFQNMDAWHPYLDVVTPMFNEQSVTAVAHKFVDRAHEMSCDPFIDRTRTAAGARVRTGSRPGSYPR